MTVVLGRFEFTLNENAENSWVGRTANYFGTNGDFSGLQLLDKIPNLCNKYWEFIGQTASTTATSLSEIGKSWKILSIVACPKEVYNATESFSDENKSWGEVLPEMCDGISSIGYAALSLIPCAPKYVGYIPQILWTTDTIYTAGVILKLPDYVSRCLQANSDCVTEANVGAKQALTEASRFYMLKIAKAIVSITGYALALYMLWYSFAAATLTAAVVSSVSTVIGVTADLYKESMTHAPKYTIA